MVSDEVQCVSSGATMSGSSLAAISRWRIRRQTPGQIDSGKLRLIGFQGVSSRLSVGTETYLSCKVKRYVVAMKDDHSHKLGSVCINVYHITVRHICVYHISVCHITAPHLCTTSLRHINVCHINVYHIKVYHVW